MTAVDMHCHIVLEALADALRARTAPAMIERAADGSVRWSAIWAGRTYRGRASMRT